jgi:oligopeptide/dipeptide ABC transporter ATP-binding protein
LALVEANKIVKRFSLGGSDFLAVNNVSIQIEKGRTYGLVGESACGKSTLALSIMVLQSIDSGEVLFDGQNILNLPKTKLRDLRRNIRMLFQNPESVLNSGMTVRQVLQEELEKEKGLDKKQKNQLIQETIGHVGLTEKHLYRYPSGLSTGEKQRDEPVASLDLSLKSSMIELLKNLQSQLELTYLYISHNLGLVRMMASKIGIMYMGILMEEASVENFTVHRVLHPYSKLLLASVPTTYPDEFREILKDYPDVEPTRFKEGCPFRNRCPFYLSNPLKDCETKIPTLKTHTPGRKVACHQVKKAVHKGLFGLDAGM